jgi:hypothetical protein
MALVVYAGKFMQSQTYIPNISDKNFSSGMIKH